VGSALGELWASWTSSLLLTLSRTFTDSYSNWYERDEEHPQKRQILMVLFAPTFWLCEEAIAQAGSLAGKIVIHESLPLG